MTLEVPHISTISSKEQGQNMPAYVGAFQHPLFGHVQTFPGKKGSASQVNTKLKRPLNRNIWHAFSQGKEAIAPSIIDALLHERSVRIHQATVPKVPFRIGAREEGKEIT